MFLILYQPQENEKLVESMRNIVYREMTIEDYDQVYNLWQETAGVGLSEADSIHHIQKFLARNQGLSFVCKGDEEIVGTVLAGHDGRRGYVYHLAVTSKFRMLGIARELTLRCLEKLREEGITKCHLFVFKENELGKNFWIKTGWIKREDILVFSKENKK